MNWQLLIYEILAFFSPHFQIPPGTPIRQCENVECPQYNVTFTNEKYEIRHYAGCRFVSTSGSFHPFTIEESAKMMEKLMRYFYGENDQNLTMPLTLPMFGEAGPLVKGSQNFTSSLMIPANFTDNTPKPLDSSVFLQSGPSIDVYVRAYGGFGSVQSGSSQMQRLMADLDPSMYVHDRYVGTSYDFDMHPLHRRNEAILVVAENTSQETTV